MTDPLIRRVLEALAGAIEELSLPDHSVLIGRRHPLPTPDLCPLLNVWAELKVATPQTTQWYDSQITVAVAWMEQAVQEIETLIGDPDIAWAIAEPIELIEAEMRRRAATDIGLTEAWLVQPGRTTYVEPALAAGLVDGYALEVLVNVTESV